MKTPKQIEYNYKSPSFEDIIKYEQLGRRLQADAFYLAYRSFKNWLIRRLSNN